MLNASDSIYMCEVMLCHLCCVPKGDFMYSHTAVISPTFHTSVIDTFSAAVQHAQRAMAQLLTVGTKVLTRHDPNEDSTASSL